MNKWDLEPDSKEFVYNGYKCEIKRQPTMKHLCGYVSLPKTSKFFQKGYDDIDVNVHGGLTYAKMSGDLWKIGFDCAHLYDYIPGMGFPNYGEETYRDMEFVEREIKTMVQQLTWSEKCQA